MRLFFMGNHLIEQPIVTSSHYGLSLTFFSAHTILELSFRFVRYSANLTSIGPPNPRKCAILVAVDHNMLSQRSIVAKKEKVWVHAFAML